MFITSYFAEFPDLQEEAIDLVYDLCEDEDEKVRDLDMLIADGRRFGYKASNRWLRCLRKMWHGFPGIQVYFFSYWLAVRC